MGDAAPPAWATTCLNCGAALAGPFCAACGQRAVPPHPTVREIVGDAFSELSGLDGKVASTVRLLLTRPGRLTNEMLEGRRARFIGPLRLYLTCSVLYFLVAAATPNRNGRPSTASRDEFEIGGLPVQVSSDVRADSVPPRDSARAAPDSAAASDSASSGAWQRLKHAAQKLNRDPETVRRAQNAYLPRALFALMPVYALLVWAFYWRRHYAEHLYFALHLHAFVFLALMVPQVGQALPGKVGNTINGIVSLLTIVWIPIYSLKALRRVYGGSRWGTLAKGTTIFVLYSIIAAVALIVMSVLAAFVA